MRSTFNLKKPNNSGKSLILFSAYFKEEGKKFVYSTGEFIRPQDWDYLSRQPKNTKGRNKAAHELSGIQQQLNRYSLFFDKTIIDYKLTDREITIATIKAEFDQEFKRVTTVSSNFFAVYNLFLEFKLNDCSDSANSLSTIRRYKYNRQLLLDFQIHRKKGIHFNQINDSFYSDLIGYCVSEKRHSANTLRRNIGLFKTFLNWAAENGHTYKLDFKRFKLPQPQITDEVALSFEEVNRLYEYDFSKNLRLEKVRDLFVFGCATGMRFSNYSKVRKSDVSKDKIIVQDQKNKLKRLEIPLNDFSQEILEKYDFQLPRMSNQKFNEYIKEVFRIAGFTEIIKKTIRIGRDLVESFDPLYERVSSHTARRSFITIMKNQKIPDKVIMGFTGHKSLEVFNKYYRPNKDETNHFMKSVWKKKDSELKVAN